MFENISHLTDNDKRRERSFKFWDLKHKNLKVYYYCKVFFRFLTPRFILQILLPFKLKQIKKFSSDYIISRVDYCNKLVKKSVKEELEPLKNLKLPDRQRVYFFDSYQYLRYFSFAKNVNCLFGDITHVPELPSFTKSRPIEGDNSNSVLLNLDKARHFLFINDPVPFASKRNYLVGRSNAHQEHRRKFLEMYFDHPLCNIGQINSDKNSHKWQVKKMSLREHLDYKFILCLEGYDVATNLKWVMSSNSLAVMPKPLFETWFMEGTLIPNYHYVEIKPDFSDLEDRLRYYIEHTDEALQIVQNANNYVKQFQNRQQENLISLMVVQKYFEKTGQAAG
ncbi:glycosyl transferase family 90 [Mangrovibacterium lignilyticum]|uniref:glycosyl transferase family 90 n=1 Tax=Mangrovibacterium lignilyticum TaxID=2668052 RepID=UPI0013D6A8C4|nr:glycosyl transferase family 90 [Mangrovibacterium lignilyticum]